MYYLKRFNLETDYQSFNGGDFITPNVSSVEENNKVYYNPKDTSVTFYIREESYTIPYSMTWREAILNPDVVTCNTDVGLYGHMFDSKPDMRCQVDNALYYNPIYIKNEETGEEVEGDGYIYQDSCIDCVHLGGMGCLEEITLTLVYDDNTPVLLNDKINSYNYYLVEL